MPHLISFYEPPKAKQ